MWLLNRCTGGCRRGFAHRLARWKNVGLTMYFYNLARLKPDFTKRMILRGVREQLGSNSDVARHFTPTYNPWDQRLCLVPDADFFKAIRSGKASVVTDQIDTFTETGTQLRSGERLDADIIVTATGLNVKLLGGMRGLCGRRCCRPVEDTDLQGNDVQRRSQSRVCTRLH